MGDAVAATIGAMERGRPGAVYNVGGGAETTMLDVISLSQRLSGRSLDVHLDETAAGDVRRTAADTTRIRADVGWTPQDGARRWARRPVALVRGETDSLGGERVRKGVLMSQARIVRGLQQ